MLMLSVNLSMHHVIVIGMQLFRSWDESKDYLAKGLLIWTRVKLTPLYIEMQIGKEMLVIEDPQ